MGIDQSPVEVTIIYKKQMGNANKIKNNCNNSDISLDFVLD